MFSCCTCIGVVLTPLTSNLCHVLTHEWSQCIQHLLGMLSVHTFTDILLPFTPCVPPCLVGVVCPLDWCCPSGGILKSDSMVTGKWAGVSGCGRVCFTLVHSNTNVRAMTVDLLSFFSGFIVKTGDRHHIFKTTSVQSMW